MSTESVPSHPKGGIGSIPNVELKYQGKHHRRVDPEIDIQNIRRNRVMVGETGWLCMACFNWDTWNTR